VAADRNGEAAAETVSKLSATGVTHISQTVDVSKRESVASLFDKVKQEYENIPANIIINCAGITRDALMLKMTDEQFDEVMNVNIRGTFYTTQIGCKHMIDHGKREWGSVVNVASTSGKYGNVGQVNYATSKAGVYGFTKSVAKEMAKYNIRCNAVVPGFIDTPMVKSIPEHLAQLSLMLIALRRKGQPEEVAEAIAFLASEKSSYITGTMIDVSGGFLM
jgi:17beta-estradiol 17-dehydrogenase/3alpha(17beta)-hydroxysteroid dehydrogenase (NAD+)